VDEARTPLIISGRRRITDLTASSRRSFAAQKEDDYTSTKRRTPFRSPKRRGQSREMLASRTCTTSATSNSPTSSTPRSTWNLFHKDQQYIIKDGEVVIWTIHGR